MSYRVLRYSADIKINFNLLTIQYVIYICKEKLRIKDEVREENLYFKYDLIDIKDIDCERLIKLDKPEELVFVVLCDFRGKDKKLVIGSIIKRLKGLVRNEQKLGEYFTNVKSVIRE